MIVKIFQMIYRLYRQKVYYYRLIILLYRSKICPCFQILWYLKLHRLEPKVELCRIYGILLALSKMSHVACLTRLKTPEISTRHHLIFVLKCLPSYRIVVCCVALSSVVSYYRIVAMSLRLSCV